MTRAHRTSQRYSRYWTLVSAGAVGAGAIAPFTMRVASVEAASASNPSGRLLPGSVPDTLPRGPVAAATVRGLMASLPTPLASEDDLYFQVLDGSSTPVSGATLTVDGYSGSLTTDFNGIAEGRVAVSDPTGHVFTTLRVTSTGNGSYIDHSFSLDAGIQTYQRVDLRGGATEIAAPGPSGSGPGQGTAQSHLSGSGYFRPHTGFGMCNGWTSLTQRPPNINVARRYNDSPTGAIYEVDASIDYQTYVEKVLPHEWYPSWPTNSLEAGALAVKDYAWNRAVREGPKFWNGHCWDVDDTTNYQVYKPSTTSTTNSAVSNSWQYWGFRSGQVFWTGYNSGYSGEPCGADNSGGTVMKQWGTVTCANQGVAYKNIFTDYYYGVSFVQMS